MIVYILCFILTALCSWKAEKEIIKGNKKRIRIWIILAILIPSVVAGCRDYSVGLDVNVYVTPTFQYAKQYNSLFDFLIFNSTWYKSVDPLFAVLTYIVSIFTNNCHWLLFIISLITNSFFFAAWVKLKNRTSISLGIVMYMLIYYIPSLNLMRQMLAASILFFSNYYMFEKKPVKYYFLVLLAIMFHSTAVIGLIIYPLYYFLYKKDNKVRFIKSATILLCSIGSISLLPSIVNLLVSFGIFPSKYLSYVSSSASTENISVVLFIIVFARLAVVLINSKALLKRNSEYFFLVQIGIVDLFLYFIKAYSEYASRLNLYTGTSFLVALAKVPSICTKKSNSYSYKAILIGLGVIYFIYSFVIQGYHNAIPYIFNVAP